MVKIVRITSLTKAVLEQVLFQNIGRRGKNLALVNQCQWEGVKDSKVLLT